MQDKIKALKDKKNEKAKTKNKLITVKSEGIAAVITAIEAASKANKVTRPELLKRLIKITRSGIKIVE